MLTRHMLLPLCAALFAVDAAAVTAVLTTQGGFEVAGSTATDSPGLSGATLRFYQEFDTSDPGSSVSAMYFEVVNRSDGGPDTPLTEFPVTVPPDAPNAFVAITSANSRVVAGATGIDLGSALGLASGSLIVVMNGDAPAGTFSSGDRAQFETVNGPLPLVEASQGGFGFMIEGVAYNLDGIGMTVTLGPRIIGMPAAAVLDQGDTLVLDAVVLGAAGAAFQWHKDGVALADDARTSGATTTQLTVADAAAADAGSYTLAVTASGDPVVSEPVVVAVAAGLPSKQVPTVMAAFQLALAVLVGIVVTLRLRRRN